MQISIFVLTMHKKTQIRFGNEKCRTNLYSSTVKIGNVHFKSFEYTGHNGKERNHLCMKHMTTQSAFTEATLKYGLCAADLQRPIHIQQEMPGY